MIDHSETEIIASAEYGEWTSIPHADELKKRLTQAAAETSIAIIPSMSRCRNGTSKY